MNDGIKIDLYEIDYTRKPAEKIEADENGNFQENLGDIYVAQKYLLNFLENYHFHQLLFFQLVF
jgi:hypothetical protein